MITGELKNKIDRVWNAFWSAGISNPLEVVEQITFLLFVRHLDDLQTSKEHAAARTGESIDNPIYTDETSFLRWSRFTNEPPENMLTCLRDGVFPWLRNLGGGESTYAHHMRDARFAITTPNLLAEVVDMLDELPLGERDVMGDMYEYMISKTETAGHSGQFRTPRHIIRLMVEMAAPEPEDEICDPACGTAGFLVASAEYVSRAHREALLKRAQHEHCNGSMFHGFDFDNTMLRIGSMNMLLHGVESPDIRYRDSLAESTAGDAEQYSLILTNPPFGGSLDYDSTAADLQQVVKTKKTELLFIALHLRLLKPGGRAAVIVPDGFLFGTTKAQKELRKILVEDQKLDAVVKLPSGVFKPYAGISTSILFFTKTNSGGTGNVWFYEVTADGWSLDGKRTPLLEHNKLGAVPMVDVLTEVEHEKNNLPDVLRRWKLRNNSELQRARTEQSFCVQKAEIASQGYDLSMNRYAERPRYFMTGRRVTLADLVDAGLLAEGAQLTFEHARLSHTARVTAVGWLELADGQQFRSPSEAAAAAAGEGFFDGWQAWTLKDGTTLDRLRQRFLDTPAAGTSSIGVGDAMLPTQRHENLKRAREQAGEGRPVTLTVRELLGWWGAQKRSYLISEQIAADLTNHSLVTHPDFDAVPLSARVRLLGAVQHADTAKDSRRIQSVNEAPAAVEGEDAPMVGLTVGNLPSALGGVVFVSPSATFDEAITHMVINDYSQLPVLSGARNVRGAVTWKSIARARHANHDPSFSHAIIRPREVLYNQDLVDILPVLAESEFVLVRDQTNAIAGIVTASDVAAAYGTMATPFFLVGEFDQRLRQVLVASFELPEVKGLCDPEGDRGIETFDDLSIGDYQRVLQNKDAWEKLGWSLDRKIFMERLDQIREIRNDLMHFNPDPLPDDAVQKIRHMINVLRQYGV
ncbi:N-6 DNA methylase [Streptomyces sp. NBC_00510]